MEVKPRAKLFPESPFNFMNEKKDLPDEELNLTYDNKSNSKKFYLYVTFAVILSCMLLFAYYMLRGRSEGYDYSISNKYEILIVSDRDTFSFDKKNKVWSSRLLKGNLKIDEEGKYKLSWNKDVKTLLQGKYVEGTRGMELSELQYWNGKLYSFCDRTGIVYEIVEKDKETLVLPRYILPEGDGFSSQKGFKSEWATVKDQKLYVGSIGKEWTTPKGEIINYSPMYIKTIDKNGNIQHIEWRKQYDALREKVQTLYPGYMVHEAVTWSNFHKKWFFLPRRVSSEKYDEEDETKRGSNILLIANEDFSQVEVKKIGEIIPTRGFSTLKFIPGLPNEIIAIKTEESGSSMKSYITIFNLDGKIIVPETFIMDEKFEGLEIRPIRE